MAAARHLAAVPELPRRVVLYVRVSALMGRAGDDFHSPDVQVGAMRRVTAGMREVEVVDLDIDVSGTTFSRKGLDRVRQLVEAGRVDVIAVYDLSRLGRNVLESLQFLKWLTDRGVQIISASEQIDTSTPAGEMMLINMLSIAQYRSREIGAGWRQIIARRAGRGQHHGRPPTGYRRGDDGGLVVDPVTGPAVRAAFRAYADGVAHREIRRQLRAATGLGMAAGTVRDLLTNETYLGIVRLRGGARVEGAHEPLLDQATWHRVQRRIRETRHMPARYQSPRYSLSGLGRCALCQHTTVIRPHGDGTPRIICNQRTTAAAGVDHPCKGCGGPALAAVEQAVLAEVREHIALLRGDVTTQAAREARAARAGADAGALQRELSDTRRAMVRLTTRWARDDRADDATFQEAMAELRDAEQQLLQQLDQLDHVATGPPPAQLAQLGEALLSMWDDMDGGQRNRALRDLVDHVTIHPPTRYRQPAADRIQVHWC